MVSVLGLGGLLGMGRGRLGEGGQNLSKQRWECLPDPPAGSPWEQEAERRLRKVGLDWTGEDQRDQGRACLVGWVDRGGDPEMQPLGCR